MKKKQLLYLSAIILIFGQCKSIPDYKNPNKSEADRVEDLLSGMTLVDKINQLSGRGFRTESHDSLGIPSFHIADGPVGVRRDSATAFPAAIALASTWDTIMIYSIGKAMAKEAKVKGINFLLGPCVNIHRIPNGGRNFESYGEDPFLNGQLAASIIKGIQSENVLASVKHFACNNQERDRFDHNVVVDERSLREIYLPAFKTAVQQGGVWSVMAAYNQVNGSHCTENEYLLNKILRKEWNFDGFVISDWGATKNTVPSIKAGMNLEMPWHGRYWHERVTAKIDAGEITNENIDELLRPLLRIRFRAGLFEQNYLPDSNTNIYKAHRALALEAAQKSIVLLKNEKQILPLSNNKLKSVAVIGKNAKETPTGGGGSSYVTPFYSVSAFDALKQKIPKHCTLNYYEGYDTKTKSEPIEAKYFSLPKPDTEKNGLYAEYFNNPDPTGKPAFTRIDSMIDFDVGNSVKPFPDSIKKYAIQWTGYFTSPVTDSCKFEIPHHGMLRVYFNDKLLIDEWYRHSKCTNYQWLKLETGKKYKIRIQYAAIRSKPVIRLCCISGKKYNRLIANQIKKAVETAKNSDIAIVFAGYNQHYETEGIDLDTELKLPFAQDKIIEAIAQANPNTIVILSNGSTISLNKWEKKVAVILETWYLGQETGNAIADVLFGQYNPSGKLTCSFPVSSAHLPKFVGYNSRTKKIAYDEGIFVGYRYLDKHQFTPLYPFGHGLSYTSFEYDNLTIEKTKEYTYKVSVTVKNTGKFAGDEIVQLYVNDKESSVVRPVKELKGFCKVSLNSGKSKRVSIPLTKSSFAYFDTNNKKWRIEPGDFTIMLGASSQDIRLKQTINIQ